ncbi:MAG: hypothetical protein F6K39_16495 [Okeania sp. SIO3B3]|nr:hypothetical protein [Okeania sp. SIO3B3]
MIELVKNYAPKLSLKYLPQLLWQRGIKDTQKLPVFSSTTYYHLIPEKKPQHSNKKLNLLKMPETRNYWQIYASDNPPNSFIEIVKNYAPKLSVKYLPQLLWHHGIKDTQKLAGFLDPKQYRPTLE